MVETWKCIIGFWLLGIRRRCCQAESYLWREANRWELGGEQNCWLGNRKGKVKRELIAA